MSSANNSERRNSKKLNLDMGSGRDTVGQCSAVTKAQDKTGLSPNGQNGENLSTLISCKKILESSEFNNEEKLLRLLSDTELTLTVKAILAEGENIEEDSVLKLSVEHTPGTMDTKGFELVKEDIMEIFCKYGLINDITVSTSKAFISFDNQISALMAKKALNGYKIDELGVHFHLDFVNPSLIKGSDSPGSELAASDAYSLNHGGLQDGQNSAKAMLFMKSSSKDSHDQKQQAAQPQSSKLTCRYDIQIDNDKDFQVAKKIIGSKGYNMKQIIDGSLNGTPYDPHKENDLIKLRLRGKGSGFKEGPAKRESDEPLHLCVSAKYIDLYSKACELVESLLTKIYADYKSHSKVAPHSELHVRKMESFFGKPESETNLFKNNPETTTKRSNIPKSAQKERHQ